MRRYLGKWVFYNFSCREWMFLLIHVSTNRGEVQDVAWGPEGDRRELANGFRFLPICPCHWADGKKTCTFFVYAIENSLNRRCKIGEEELMKGGHSAPMLQSFGLFPLGHKAQDR